MGRPRKSPSMTDGKREIISRLIEEYDRNIRHPIPNTMTQETVTNQRLYAPTTDL